MFPLLHVVGQSMVCFSFPHPFAGEEVIMSAAYRIPVIAARATPMAKAGVVAGLGKAVLFAVPTALVGAALVYGLFKAFDVRWDEFSRRPADGESTMGRASS
jgi:hypothetical protein